MIKLKDIILEIVDEFGETRPVISKVEEQEALQLIIKQLVPEATKDYNRWVRRVAEHVVTVDQVKKNLRKAKIERFTNGMEIVYISKVPAGSIHFRMRKLAWRKRNGDGKDGETFDIGYYDISSGARWGEMAWNNYDVSTARAGINFDDYTMI